MASLPARLSRCRSLGRTTSAPAALFASSLLSLAAVLLAGCGEAEPADAGGPNGPGDLEPVAVSVTRPTVEPIDDVFLSRSATLAAVSTMRISTRQEGFVRRFAPNAGDYVLRGDLLFELDDTERRLMLAELEAARDAARVNLSDRERSAQRTEELFARDVLSKELREDEQSALARARAEYEEARLRVARAKEELEALKIYAPTDGAITDILTQSGEYLNRGDAALELKQINVMIAACTVNERFLDRVREGASVYVAVNAYPDRLITGLIWKIIPDALLDSRSFPVQILLPNPDLTLKPGMSGEIRFVRHVDEAILVPKDAVLEPESEPHVFAVHLGHAVRKDVELGPASGDRWQVRSGVDPRDVLVAAGNENLSDGAPVRVVELPPPGRPDLSPASERAVSSTEGEREVVP